MTETIKTNALEQALAVAGWIHGDVVRLLDLARRIQELPEHQRLIRVDSLREKDLDRIVTIKVLDSDDYLTGRLTDFVSDNSSRLEFILVLDGKAVRTRYDQEVVVDNRIPRMEKT